MRNLKLVTVWLASCIACSILFYYIGVAGSGSVRHAYHCGEYRGQQDQFRFYSFTRETNGEYQELHQFTDNVSLLDLTCSL